MDLAPSPLPGRNECGESAPGQVHSETLDDVYRTVHNVLSNLASGLLSAECTTLAINTVYSTVHKAVADFAVTWNKDAPTVLSSLPSELWVCCLSWLSFRDKISASHVSRGWRRFALAAPSLWNTVDTTPSRSRRAADLFREIIARSGDVPLDVTLPAAWRHSGKVAALPFLALVTSRIRSLTLSVPLDFQFDLDGLHAPLLEYLDVDAQTASAPIRFPGNGSALMPRLKSLEMNHFVLPSEFEPMQTLTQFIGHLTSDTDVQHLAELFPCLTAVSLQSLRNATSFPRMPSAVQTLEVSVYTDSVDPMDILRSVISQPARSVKVTTILPLSAVDTFDTFNNSDLGEWSLSLSSVIYETVVTILRGAGDWDVNLGLPDFASDDEQLDPELFRHPQFDRLYSLSLSGRVISQILSAGVHFPSLVALAIFDDDLDQDCELHRALAVADARPMRLPALQTLCLTVKPTWNFPPPELCTVRLLPLFIGSRLSYNAPRLLQITIVHMDGTNPAGVVECSAQLTEHASRVVSVGAGAHQEWFAPDGDTTVDDSETEMPLILPLLHY